MLVNSIINSQLYDFLCGHDDQGMLLCLYPQRHWHPLARLVVKFAVDFALPFNDMLRSAWIFLVLDF